MGIKSVLAKVFAAYISSKVKKDSSLALEHQELIRNELLQKAANTKFGKDHQFSSIQSYDDFKTNMDLWLNRFRSAKPMEGQEKVYVAGDIERSMEATRMKEGIPLVEEVVKDLEVLATKFDLSI
jgi:archaellum component FlaC